MQVSVDGGATGIKVGIMFDGKLTVELCDPIIGVVTDHVVTWGGKSSIAMLNGAVSIVFKIPADATAFAFSI